MLPRNGDAESAIAGTSDPGAEGRLGRSPTRKGRRSLFAAAVHAAVTAGDGRGPQTRPRELGRARTADVRFSAVRRHPYGLDSLDITDLAPHGALL